MISGSWKNLRGLLVSRRWSDYELGTLWESSSIVHSLFDKYLASFLHQTGSKIMIIAIDKKSIIWAVAPSINAYILQDWKRWGKRKRSRPFKRVFSIDTLPTFLSDLFVAFPSLCPKVIAGVWTLENNSVFTWVLCLSNAEDRRGQCLSYYWDWVLDQLKKIILTSIS